MQGFQWITSLLISTYLISYKEIAGDPDVIAAVIDNDNVAADFIQIVDPPRQIVNKHHVTLEYKCSRDTVIGFEILTVPENDSRKVKVFKKRWLCPEYASDLNIRKRKIKLRLPLPLAYNYNLFNSYVMLTSGTKLRAWIIDNDWWKHCKRQDNCYSRASVKVSYDTVIPPPYSRPFYKRPCHKWSWDIVTIATAKQIPCCPVEQEIIQAIEYPVVLGGLMYGVYRQFKPYVNPELEQYRRGQFLKPRFTVAVWLYVLEFCPGPDHPAKTCGIMYHFNWKAEIKTAMIMFKPEGDVHIQVQHTDQSYSAGRTHRPLPLKKWVRLVVNYNVNEWTVVVNYDRYGKNTTESSFVHPGPTIFMDDTEGLFTFGGGENFNSFRGYIGQATYYRNKIVHHSQIPYPSEFHPMYELDLLRREQRCERYMNWVDQRIELHKVLLQYKIESGSCRNPFYEMVTGRTTINTKNTCRLKAKKQRRNWAVADRIVKKQVYQNQQIDVRSMSDQLYENASNFIETDVSDIPKAVSILKQAACYGNTDAMYMLSVILNNGLFVKADEIQSQAYLMLAALESHRLSELALAHKHRYGIDGVTLDFEQAFRYFKYVADTTRADKELHKDTDVFTESIRLTDEAAVKEQTDEDGDIFHWMKHQAKQGVLSAQSRMGRLLYWGSNGLKRNLADAMEYFRMSAETGDAQSQYDYGIVLMRGQGTEKNVEKGLEQLHMAADQQNDQAMNALGWHAREFQKDNERAAEFFERAYKRGNAEAAYNLGIMHLYGHYPGLEADADKALQLFFFAGQRGQIDAGVAIAYQCIKGTGRAPRDVYTAVEWARFIAEKNPSIGFILRKAMKAYREGKMELSLFYYSMAAEAGLEVGSFNVAWLCEENQNGISSFIEKNCQWRHYNLSTQREPQFVDSYSLIKMGDFYWYGCKSDRDVNKAANYYAQAAVKHNPQAIFNIAFMMEEGVHISRENLDFMRIPRKYQANNVTLLDYLYTRCKDSRESEAYIPCSIALWRLHFNVAWTQYQTVLKIAGFTGVLSILTASSYIFVRSHLRQTHHDLNTI